MSYAIHNQNLAFNDSAIAQYMNTDFIVIDISLCVALAREQFFGKLKDDDIPSHIFIEDNGRLAGLIAVRKLLQATDTVQPVKGLMISDFIQLKPEDERADVAGVLAHAGADVVPVVAHGKLVGCLTEREIAHLLEDDVTEDAQLQGATLPLEKPYLETSAFSLWKKRSVWLLLLFVAEAYTSSVIQHFEEALESAIALAFFIPLLIGTGGNSGTQITSTLVRAMALGEVHLRDMGRVIRKEVIDLVSDCPDPGSGGLPARLDDGDWHGNHAHRQPDAGLHYPVERHRLLGHSDGTETLQNRSGGGLRTVYRHANRRHRADYLLQNCAVYAGAGITKKPCDIAIAGFSNLAEA